MEPSRRVLWFTRSLFRKYPSTGPVQRAAVMADWGRVVEPRLHPARLRVAGGSLYLSPDELEIVTLAFLGLLEESGLAVVRVYPRYPVLRGTPCRATHLRTGISLRQARRRGSLRFRRYAGFCRPYDFRAIV